MPTLGIAILPSLVLISHLVHPLPLSDEKNQWDSNQVDLSYLGSEVFSQPDEEVENWDPSEENPEELGGYVEGDMIFSSGGRNALIAETSKWKDGIVPYEIGRNFTEKDFVMINKAMEMFKKYTCITFRPKTDTDTDYVSIVNGQGGCWSHVGHVGGKQEISLHSPNCTAVVGRMLHELMHTLGFQHEHNRYDRDDYISIVWENMKEEGKKNCTFCKDDKDLTTTYGVPYDYGSLLHYAPRAYSLNGQPTIVAKYPVLTRMGQRANFSIGDITKINARYNCPEKTLEVTKGNSGLENVGNNNNNLGTGEKGHKNPLINAASRILSFFFNK